MGERDGVFGFSDFLRVSVSQWFALASRISGHTGLVELIGRKGGKVTVRELQQSTQLFKTADEAHTALAELVEARIGRWETPAPGPAGGRPTQVFRLNEAPAVYETPVDSPENGGFVGVDNVDNATTGDDWGEV
jgi:hypothetical protein